MLGSGLPRLRRAGVTSPRRFVSDEPQHQSPFCAELYRWGYGKLGRPTNRLLIEAYAQWDPYWTLRTRPVPFWLRFNMGPDYDELAEYLTQTEPYDVIRANLFSQGIESPDVVPVQRWEELVRRHARDKGEIIGVTSGARLWSGHGPMTPIPWTSAAASGTSWRSRTYPNVRSSPSHSPWPTSTVSSRPPVGRAAPTLGSAGTRGAAPSHRPPEEYHD